MAWISASLAFAITMLIVSMVASVFVETLHRIIGLREKGLHLMVGQFYDRVLGPYLEARGTKPEELKKAFLDLTTLNRAPSGVAGKGEKQDDQMWKVSETDEKSFDWGLLSWLWSGRRLSKLDVSQFMSRLGDSDVGDHISNTAENSAAGDDVLKDIASKFDAFGREASIYFERRARLTSVLVGFVVAYFMYVHPYELFKTYMTNPEVTQAVINMQDQVLGEYEKKISEEIIKNTNVVKEAEDNAKTANNDSDNASPEIKPELKTGLVTKATDANEKLRTVQKDLDSSFAKAREAVESLAGQGVPIGWTEARARDAGFKFDSNLGLPWPHEGKALRTFIWLLVGGLLVGLGAPFWYDMVKSLSSIRTLVSGTKSLTNPDGTAKAPEEQPIDKTAAAVDQFKLSIAGRKAVDESRSIADDDEAVG